MKLSQIKPNDRNPRYIKDEAFAKLCDSLRDFGDKMMPLRPIVVDADGIILGGNMRYRALKKLGFNEVPDSWVRRVSDLSDEDRKKFVIADNSSFGQWDFDVLANEYDMSMLDAFCIEVPDVDFSGKDDEDAEDDAFDMPNIDEVNTIIKPGDLISIGRHRLICGDSTKEDTFKALMGGNMADLVVTDPPYNVAYDGGVGRKGSKTRKSSKIENDSMPSDDFYEFLKSCLTSMSRVVKQGGGWYIWRADSEGMNFRKAMVDSGISLKQTLIWRKNSICLGRQDYQWIHEPCLYGWMPGASHAWYSDRKQTTVLEFPKPQRSDEHPTMKPVPLFGYQIGNSSKQGDIVLDAFGGSGTTMIACHQMGRTAYLCELTPKYCQVIIDRMVKLDDSIEVKINGLPYEKLTETDKS